MLLNRMLVLVIGIVLLQSCQRELSTGIRDVVTDPRVDDTTAFVLPSTITFDLRRTGNEKNGLVGFLGSVTTAAPADELITPLKPALWRTGRQGDAFALYPRLNRLGVKRQLLLVSDYRNYNSFYTDIFQRNGYGALTDTLARRAKEAGYNFEWDLFNEPNDSLKTDFSRFMAEYWNPAYHAVKKYFPEAAIHGPSATINNTANARADSMLVYQFIDSAIAYNTLPDYINWHFQIGYNISDWHNGYRNSIVNYINGKGKTIKGVFAGETIRPGDERNTSPGVAIDVFAAAEVYGIPQVRASWTSQTVYGVGTYPLPVLGGLFNNTNGTGPRGVWWAHAFYAAMSGKRVLCANTPTGTDLVTGIAFRDDAAKRVTAMLGARDGLSAAQLNPLQSRGYTLLLANMSELSGLVVNGKVHVKVWRNRQTRDAVTGYGSAMLPLIIDADLRVDKNKLQIPFVVTGQWDALLVTITPPVS
ncbi:hypothetical protein [Niabella drilacis]|uniref:Glycosyl hydrolases family 39 n=1 Tax=Niabella drilacis (strain DSM 25811 / CCM 8410 / CCUG 62505 / LMG 26954 / E90) TaxID=1285928 RepID=A0A1G6TAW3_NIADE|nr:hypothetical protein [Niabella drilacis]SDD25617.1 hypothetical protein SAMN04487894_107140 [Niabella drilacis]